jgi:peptide/nickel transport system permease protein
LLFIPQLVGVTLITFYLIRLLPGDPAVRLAGILATPARVHAIRVQLGLDHSIISQYVTYVGHALTGNLGQSTVTNDSVSSDIAQRLPATIELIGLALIIGLLITVPLGIYTAIRPKSRPARGVFLYGMLAGALPDFWLGLLLIYFFFTLTGLLPAPVGQIAIQTAPPPHITGAYALDALLSGSWSAFGSAVEHLILPVGTLVFVYSGIVLKQTRSAMHQILETPWMRFAVASGIRQRTIMRYGLRNALPQVLTVIGVVLLFLIGGAVLVEQIFSWGGLGQYAVAAIQQSDYQAIQGFVLVAAIISLLVNLGIDVLYGLVDPRIRVARS